MATKLKVVCGRWTMLVRFNVFSPLISLFVIGDEKGIAPQVTKQ